MLSQFEKKTLCSDLDQHHLFRSFRPISNGNYGINLHDPVPCETLYLYTVIAEK